MNLIAVDAMGGDHAPAPEVAGAVAAVREADLEVVLVGDAERLRAELAALGAAALPGLQIQHADEVVTMHDHPGQVFRKKRGSSLRVAFDLVKEGRAAGVVSAGNSGAVLSHALFVLGRLRAVERPGIVTVFPTPTGSLVLCDMGANVEVRPTMLAQFGILGACYDRVVHVHARPRVGLLSNGTEESKGTELTRAAHALLSEATRTPGVAFEYVGYVEGSSIFSGDIDVVATDGFTGNVVLKLSEGVAEAVFRMVKEQLGASLRGRLGGALVRPAMLELKKSIDYAETGGALLAGVDGVVLIGHGRSDANAIKNAIKAADRFARAGLTAQLATVMERHQRLWAEPAPAADGAARERA
jgi:phosphate acyltransferase